MEAVLRFPSIVALVAASIFFSAEAWSFSELFGYSSSVLPPPSLPAVLDKADEENKPAGPMSTVTLTKQYVPVVKNGVAVAYRTSYFGEIYVGTPRSLFTVVFDTGSGHLILPNSRCKSAACANHRRYDSKTSTSAIDIEHNGNLILPTADKRDQVAISFGTGRVVGEFAQDQACFSLDENSLCTPLRIVLANDMTSDPFESFHFDGVLGLGLKALTLNDKFSFFGEMSANNPEMLPQFSVFLARNEEEGKSQITFGGHDPRLAATDIQWRNVALEHLGYWQVQVVAIRVGNVTLEDCEDGTCRAIADTGTSLLGVPRQAVRNMHRMLARPVPDELQGSDSVDCRTIAGEDLHFDLGDGVVITLSPEDYSRPTPINVTVPDKQNATLPFCRSLLLPIDMKAPLGPKIFIWGEPLLRKYYTIYDWGKKRIGFSEARQLPPAETVEASSSSFGAPAGALVPGAPLATARKTVNNTMPSTASAKTTAPESGPLASTSSATPVQAERDPAATAAGESADVETVPTAPAAVVAPVPSETAPVAVFD